jgi:hypothetical protein
MDAVSNSWCHRRKRKHTKSYSIMTSVNNNIESLTSPMPESEVFVEIRCSSTSDDYYCPLPPNDDDTIMFVDAGESSSLDVVDVVKHSTKPTILRGEPDAVGGFVSLHSKSARIPEQVQQFTGSFQNTSSSTISFQSPISTASKDVWTAAPQLQPIIPSQPLPYWVAGKKKESHHYHNEDAVMDDGENYGLDGEDNSHDDDTDTGGRLGTTSTPITGSSLLMNSNNINNTSSFDEKIFFSIPSFDNEIFRTVEDAICTRIEGQLCRLEQEHGIDLYKNYLVQEKEKRIQKLKNDIIDEEKHLQKSFDDSFVKGHPRNYQKYILEVAKSKNTIVNLGTGSGKTLIAIMCIQDMSSAFYTEEHTVEEQQQEGQHNNIENMKRKNGKKSTKQTLFLVPSVALAIQQSLTLRANLPNFSIATAFYTSASSKTARKNLANSNIIVATHGAVRLSVPPYTSNYVQCSLFLTTNQYACPFIPLL